MFKKASKIAVSFALLVGAYAGYTRLFAFITDRLEISRDDVGVPFPEPDSKSSRKANELALESFGPGHFASAKSLKLQYYDAVRGFYMYAQEKKFLKDNKQIHVRPFALIWVSSDGKSRKTATSDEAIIDLNQPFLQVKPSTEPSRVTHAQLIGDVRLRDDKGTPDEPSDDLRVGPLTYVEFDDASLQITSDSDVFLQDRDLTLNGSGLMIQLRRKLARPDDGSGPGTPPPSGFDAETAFIYKDVHIVVNNVTSEGILPGKAKPEKTGKTPIDVRSDREMRIDLPRPRRLVAVGPPDIYRAPDPTFVKFKTNVRVIRGTDKADQLNCDTLDLTLLPDVKKVEALAEESEDEEASVGMLVADATTSASESGQAPAKPPAEEGPLTELKIRKAIAKGDAVWLQSEAQGMVARCVELIYEKHVDGSPDITYLNGGLGKKLWVEKVDLDPKAPVPGTIKSIMRLTALDATIFDSGNGGSSKVIARGPGKTEERPARNASVARTVWWEDEMELLTWREGEGAAPTPSPLAARSLSSPRPAIVSGTLRRLITLAGVAKLVDHTTSTTLDAQKSIVAEFQAEPNLPPLKGEGPTQIKWLDAFEDAHLTAPSKSLTARQFLKAKFENPPPPPAPILAAPGASPAPGSAPVVVAAATPPPAESTPDAAPKPVEPLVDGRADRVWASVLLGSTGETAPKSKGELKNAQLRGGVMLHQDPAPGKAYGSDASGEALDLAGQGNGLMEFKVKAEDTPPQASDPKTRLASETKSRKLPPALLARVEFEGKVIESVDIIGVNQKADFAWVMGAGTFVQMADRGLLDDRGIEGEKVVVNARPAGPNPKDKMVIDWTDEMRFYGRSVDLQGRPAAKIEFRGVAKDVRTPDGRREFRSGVNAKLTDSAIFADTMDVYMDKLISFSKDTSKPAAAPGEPKPPDPQIALLDCKGKDIFEDNRLEHPGVAIVSQKLYPENGEMKEKQRIQGQHIIYDKRTGLFEGQGSGMAWIYRRKGDAKADGSPVVPVSAPSPTNASVTGRSRPEVVLSAKKLMPIELTKIKFAQGMRGRFGVAKDGNETERRDAEFYGAVEAVNASVNKSNGDIDFDHVERWPDFTFLTSDVLNIFNWPAPKDSKAPSRQLLDARGNALVRMKFDAIQADRVTFDSNSGLAYAYGDDGKEVSFTKTDSFGQRPSTTKMKSLRYNKNDRSSDINDPQALSFTDLKSGIRSKPYFPDLGGSFKMPDPPKLPRPPLQRQNRNSTERNSFTGH